MKKFRLLTALPLVLSASFPLTVLSNCSQKKVSVEATVSEDQTFHNFALSIKTSQLLAAGFEFGDSVDIIGPATSHDLPKDIPYYSGYFAKHGGWVLCSYAKGEFVSLAKNCRQTPIKDFGINEGDKIKIVLKQRAKYLKTQINLDIKPVLPKGSLSDVQWTNFHDCDVDGKTKIKSQRLYRGFSTVCISDVYGTRRNETNTLCEANNIDAVYDIGDDEATVNSYLSGLIPKQLQWIKSKKEAGFMYCDNMGVDFSAENVHKQVKDFILSLTTALQSGKKVYIHCHEGKDRTGFIFVLLHSLAETEEQYLIDDFMLTFINIYNIKKGTEQYDAIFNSYYNSFKEEMTQYDEGKTVSMKTSATNYLLRCGLTQQQIDSLTTEIKKSS